MYDLIVIGGGLGGYGAAIRAAQKGKKVLLIEKNKIGGVCLNTGCIPTKAFLQSSNLYSTMKESEKFGIKTGELSFDWKEIVKFKDGIVNRLVKGVEFLLKKNKVEIIAGEAFFKKNDTVSVNGKDFKGNNILIAVGSKPAIPLSFEKFKSDKIIFSDKFFEFEKIPSSMVIIGGGVIGIEIASVLNGFGSKVEIIEILDEILPGIERDIVRDLKKTLKKRGIKIHTETSVEDISEKDSGLIVKAKKGEQEVEIETDYVMIATGRVANTCSLKLKNTSVKTEKRGFIKTDKYFKAAENIYAVGDVIGGKLLAHKALHEGISAVENIFDNAKISVENSLIPAVVYTEPEIATVGFTENEAKEKFNNIRVGKFPLAANGKSLIQGNSTGFVKLIFAEDVLVGATLLSPSAGEMISALTYMIKEKAKYKDLEDIIFPHPTVSESIGEAFMNAFKEAIHIIN